MQMPQKPKRQLSLYVIRIMADLISTTKKNSTSQCQLGFGHKCHKHNRLIDLEHIANCDLLGGCPDIAKYVKMINEGGNIRMWD
jgi:hypothetical protein